MDGNLKSVVFSELARMGQALASPLRLELLDWLCQRDFSVEELAGATGAGMAVVSHHLQKLKAARLVEARIEGPRRVYSIRSGVPALWRSLSAAGNENLAEIRAAMSEFLDDPGAFDGVSWRTLRRRAKAGEVLVIDVRPGEEYAAGHFPDAMSVPVERLDEMLRDLPADREIVAYCRGPYCLLSHEAVRRLRERGYRASRWAAGTADWLAEGVKLETGAVPGKGSRS